MVLEVPTIEAFIAEAKEADVTRVCFSKKVEYRHGNSIPTCRMRVVVTAVGASSRPRSLLLVRYEKDFGPTLMAGTKVPEEYLHKVEEVSAEVNAKLNQAGFEVRDGEIVSV